jgi:hypothetical protein
MQRRILTFQNDEAYEAPLPQPTRDRSPHRYRLLTHHDSREAAAIIARLDAFTYFLFHYILDDTSPRRRYSTSHTRLRPHQHLIRVQSWLISRHMRILAVKGLGACHLPIIGKPA